MKLTEKNLTQNLKNSNTEFKTIFQFKVE